MDGKCRVHWNAEILSEIDGHISVYKMHTHEISMGGVIVFVDEMPHIKNPVTFVFKIPKGKSISEWSTVRVISKIVSIFAKGDEFEVILQFQTFLDSGKKLLEDERNTRIVLKLD